MPNWTSKDRKPDKAGVKRAKVGNPEGLQPGTILPGSVCMKQPGSVHAITRDLKQGIVDAAIKYGSDGNGKDGLTGYLYFLAGDHPKAFSSLLGRLLPLQVAGTATFVGAINIMPVPAGHYLTAEQINDLTPLPLPLPTDPDDTPPTIDNAA